MELKLKRDDVNRWCTCGRLYVNGVYFCDTLEPIKAELNDKMQLKLKLAEERGNGTICNQLLKNTCIPCGTYEVEMAWSPKFERIMPQIKGVKHRSGILIHGGNRVQDTTGCILVGRRLPITNMIMEKSQATFDNLFDLLERTKSKKITIEITEE